ncbi:MAG: hypothetical protein ABF271_12795 [Abyssibacter sp.]|uniref:hypothetical protein n=1 Tax=Abyssibacter sp. TaxID=2320200 RepID=UPI00321B4BF5
MDEFTQALIALAVTAGCGYLVYDVIRTLRMRLRSRKQQYAQRVVGTSNYQDELSSVVGGRARESQRVPVLARLILESGNAKDPNAVQVRIKGRLVGYLPAVDALRYRETMPPQSRTVDALVIGGWAKNQHDQGNFGVRVEMP